MATPQAKKLEEFMQQTHADEDVAKVILTDSNWDIQQAIQQFCLFNANDAKNENKNNNDELKKAPNYCFQDFNEAKQMANDMNVWLLMNIQSDDDVSKYLNAKIWNDKDFSQTVQHYFILYQCDGLTSNGIQLLQNYNLHKIPSICIINTNGKMEKEIDIKETLNQTKLIMDQIIDFLTEYMTPALKTDSTSVLKTVSISSSINSVSSQPPHFIPKQIKNNTVVMANKKK